MIDTRAWIGVAAACVLAGAAGCSTGPRATAGSGGGTSSSGSAGSAGSAGGPAFVQAAHTPFPALPASPGPALTMPRLVMIVGPGEPFADKLFAFGDALLESAWLAATGSDYGVGAGAGATSMHLTGAAVPATMDETALRAYVQATIAANAGAAPDGHTVYLFFYPPGTGRGDSCFDIGAHDTLSTADYMGTPTDALAWVQRCPPPAGTSELDALTITASHEVLESATDPSPPHGVAMPFKTWSLAGKVPPWGISSWSYLQNGAVEVADLCAGTVIEEGGFAYQRSWSTTAAALEGDPCAPALSAPYYSASAPQDWIDVPAGSTASVPVTGWSTGPRADWHVTVRSADFIDGGFSATFDGGGVTTTLNNGKAGTLSITTPAAPGAFAVFTLLSSESPPDPMTGQIPQPASGDQSHLFAFGLRTTCAGCTPPPACGDGTCDTSSGETCASCPDDCGPCGAIGGANNFSVACSSGAFCPTHSTCQASGSCACDAGYTTLSTGGSPCSGPSCAYPSWWCVPAQCGMSNFVTPCSSGFCPADAICAGGNECTCAPGTLAVSCDGQPCPAGGCSYPDYWCAVCGTPNTLVPCKGSGCPSLSACNPDGSCTCLSGYRAVSCDGEPCAGANCATSGAWWCIPD